MTYMTSIARIFVCPCPAASSRLVSQVSSEREKAVNNLIQRLLRRALDTVWDRERAVGSGSATRR